MWPTYNVYQAKYIRCTSVYVCRADYMHTYRFRGGEKNCVLHSKAGVLRCAVSTTVAVPPSLPGPKQSPQLLSGPGPVVCWHSVSIIL